MHGFTSIIPCALALRQMTLVHKNDRLFHEVGLCVDLGSFALA